MIRLRLFGTLDLRGQEGEEILSVLAQPKRTALLSFLAASDPVGYHQRDTLLGFFWPDLPQDRARAALRKALHHLRRSLGEGVLLTRGESEVGLNRTLFACDVVEFAEALEEGDPDTALELYEGDLLPGFFLSEAPEFERWVERERERLRNRAAQAAWDRAHRLLECGEVNDAERSARLALDLLPTDESEVRRFSLVLAEKGDRGGAYRLLTSFRQEMEEELGLSPSDETLAALEEIRNGQEPEDPPAAGSLPQHPLPTETRAQTASLPASPLPSQAGPEGSPPWAGRSHMVQWGATFIAAGWALIALVGLLERQLGLPEGAAQVSRILVAFGCFGAMILTWYHGHQKRTRVSGPELLMIALLLGIMAIALSMVGS